MVHPCFVGNSMITMDSIASVEIGLFGDSEL
jgi:hypothetical protein